MITVYDILANDERGGVSARMINWIEKLPKETIALVERNASRRTLLTKRCIVLRRIL